MCVIGMAKKKILVVEDEEELLKIYGAILGEGGYDVDLVSTGADAMKKATKGGYSLLMVDIKLPDVMGDEIVKDLRAQGDKTPIIIVTGYPSLSRSIDTLDLGIHEILIKPLTSTELLRVTKEALV
jgi:two-component system repressor protein LuxO